MSVNVYLSFDGRCKEALDFYKEHLGAEILQLHPYRESPDPAMIPTGWEDKILHAAFKVEGSLIMASDVLAKDAKEFGGFWLLIDVGAVERVREIFDALKVGGTVVLPLQETFFARLFGQVIDRFGIPWSILKAA